MEGLLEPARLRIRVTRWAQEEIAAGTLPPRSIAILDAILYRGQLARGEVESVTATGERQARRTVAELIRIGALSSEGPRAPLHLAFPATLAARWLPGLFPDPPPQPL
jgi:hypothetical protein